MNDGLTIVVPAFNERAALERLLPGWLDWCEASSTNLIIVDDGSSDQTAVLLESYVGHPRLRALRHRKNRGYGNAIKTGIYQAGTPYVSTMDADGQHAIEDTRLLLTQLIEHDVDLVVGSRTSGMAGGIYRGMGKAIIRYLARVLFSETVRDLNSGMKVFRTELVKRILPMCPGTMAFSDVVTLTHLNLDCTILEVPIGTLQREEGTSTINTMTAVDTIIEIINVVMWFRPLRIFLPLSTLLVFAGAVWATPFLLMGRGLSSSALLLVMTGLMSAMLGLIAEQQASTRRIDLHDLAIEVGDRSLSAINRHPPYPNDND